jgi:hypothetical protein
MLLLEPWLSFASLKPDLAYATKNNPSLPALECAYRADLVLRKSITRE